MNLHPVARIGSISLIHTCLLQTQLKCRAMLTWGLRQQQPQIENERPLCGNNVLGAHEGCESNQAANLFDLELLAPLEALGLQALFDLVRHVAVASVFWDLDHQGRHIDGIQAERFQEYLKRVDSSSREVEGGCALFIGNK